MPISAEAKQQIKAALAGATANTGVPGIVFIGIDKKGEYLAEEVAGTVGLDSKKPMTLDSVFWIASCTKMIVGLAALQLVEQGKLDLDSSDHLYKLVPELKSVKVLDTSDGTMSEKKKEITLRMLLTHTAGFGYSFFNPKLRDFGRPAGIDELSGELRDVVQSPLVNQPGSRWEYGTGIDWAGIAVERASGLTLDAYFKKNIFEPLGIKNISFLPNAHMVENQVSCQQRHKDGSVEVIDHPFRKALIHSGTKDADRLFHSGGAGCFAKPKEYALIIAALLNDGVSPNTGNRILSKASVDEAFKNQIPEFPDYSRTAIPDAKPLWTNPLPQLYPQEGDPPQGWGLTFMITIEPGPTGRGRNTGWWAGIVNLFWWADREKGVGGIIASQVLPFGDGAVMGAWGACEAALYSGLQ